MIHTDTHVYTYIWRRLRILCLAGVGGAPRAGDIARLTLPEELRSIAVAIVAIVIFIVALAVVAIAVAVAVATVVFVFVIESAHANAKTHNGGPWKGRLAKPFANRGAPDFAECLTELHRPVPRVSAGARSPRVPIHESRCLGMKDLGIEGYTYVWVYVFGYEGK